MCWCFLCESVLLAQPDGWMAGASERAAPSPALAPHFFLFVGKSWVKTFSPTFIGQEPPLSTCYHWPRLAHALPYGANPLGPLARSAIKYLARSLARSPPQPTTPKPRAQSSAHFWIFNLVIEFGTILMLGLIVFLINLLRKVVAGSFMTLPASCKLPTRSGVPKVLFLVRKVLRKSMNLPEVQPTGCLRFTKSFIFKIIRLIWGRQNKNFMFREKYRYGYLPFVIASLMFCCKKSNFWSWLLIFWKKNLW